MTVKSRKPQRKITLTLLLGMFFCMSLIAYVVVKDTVKDTIESEAVAFAEIAAVQATTARSVYAKEIAEKLRKDGSGPNVDYEHMKDYVPIPAQFLKMLGRAATANTADLYHYKLVSKWNLEAGQGLNDDFLNWAWPQIEKQDNPAPSAPIAWKPIWRFERQDGQKVLRYLSPDAASQQSCVSCHNSYENRPEIKARRAAAHVAQGKQWKQYQLLGAISITIPLKKVEEMAAVRVRKTSGLILGILLASLLLAIWFSRRLARQEISLLEVERDLRKSEQETRDAKELLLAKQDVERAFNELSAYIRAIDQHAIVSVADVEGRIIQVNQKFCMASGYCQEELIGQNHRIVNSGVHPQSFFADMWRTIASGDIWRGECCNRTKSGALYWVDSTIVPLKDTSGQIVRYISIRLEITERKKAQQQLEAAHNIVHSSIQYASRIQRAILPPDDHFRSYIPDHFVLWEPRDVVGGDMYWCKPWGEGCLVILGDCTGHGVPGAFMTMLSAGALDRAILDVAPGRVDELLQHMHQILQHTLNQDRQHGHLDDGIEMGVCYLTGDRSMMFFAGARFDLYILKNGAVNIVKGNKSGVGYRNVPVDQQYARQEIIVDQEMIFYMVSDGIIDQVGRETGWGVGRKLLLKWLADAGNLPLAEQREHIFANFLAYQGNEKRRDDISVIGFRV